MPIKRNETRFTDTHLPIRIQKCPHPPPPIHSFSLCTPQPANFKCSFTLHQDNFISMAFCPQETLFAGIALTCFNNIFSNNELISNRFAVFVTCTYILTVKQVIDRFLFMCI